MTERKVLIVEDESIVRLHLRRVLEGMGHRVTGLAASAREALSSAASIRPDLVIMDIHLGGKRDGIETAKEIRRLYGSAVVFATAYADDKTIERTSAVGAQGYIVKPFSERTIRAVLSTALAENDRNRNVRKNEESLTTILSSLGEAVFVADEECRITFMNQSARELVGSSSEDRLGQSLLDVLHPNEEDRPELSRLLEMAGTTREKLVLPTMTIMGVDDAEKQVNGWIEPLESGNGSHREIVVSFRNMSERWLGRREKPERVARGDKTRMMIYSHDTFGLGHLRRCLNLSAALVAKNPDLSILLVTGSAVVHRYPLPPRVDYVKLPAVRKVARGNYEPRMLGMSNDGVRDIRSNLIQRTVRDFDPDVVLVDHSPVGMRGEMRPALEWLHDNRPGCIKIVGLRDIIDDPQAIIASWKRKEIYHLLTNLYDHIVIYGTRSIFDSVQAYQFSAELASRTRFLNYVVEKSLVHSPTSWSTRNESPRKRVMVTAGGGDGAVELIVGTFLEMLEKHEAELDLDSLVFPGPLVAPDLLESIRRRADGVGVTIHDFVESTSPYMQEADLVICTGGYNTTTQALRYARRALIIPRVMYRKEQLIRATRLKELGLVETIHPDELTPDRLYEVLSRQLSTREEHLTEARRQNLFQFNGAEMMADFCSRLMASKPRSQEAAYD